MTKIQLFHSQTPGNVPPDGLLVGEVAYNVADNVQFIGYGGDINYDVYGNPLPDLPPPGMGWKTFVTGGGDQPGPPGPGVPVGGTTGQVLSKLSDGDYVTGWTDTFGPAQPNEVGVVYGLTTTSIGGNSSVALGFNANVNIGTGLRNTAIGFQAGLNQNDVSDNVVLGYQAAWNIDGGQNVVIGSEAFGNDPGGSALGNVGVGYQAGYNLTGGDYNVFLGYQSGIGVRNGSGNVIIGNYPGGSDWEDNVVLADGSGNIKFLANQAGAWSTDGEDFGQTDFVLTSQGANLPPVWKEVPLGFVSKIVAGQNVTIDPSSGTGVVTINAAGGGIGGVTSVKAGNGLQVANGGANPIISSGELQIDYTKVVATSLYSAKGALLYASAAGAPSALLVGSAGQLLQAQADGTIAWQTIPSSSPATPSTLGLVYGSTDSEDKLVAIGYGAGIAVTTGASNVFIGPDAGSAVTIGSGNVIIGAYSGTANLNNNIILSDGDGTQRLQIDQSGSWAVNNSFGLPGQVLTSTGQNSPTYWATPVNAPIQTVTDGPGISTSLTGVNLEISNEGVLAVSATGPIVASTTAGVVSLSAPNVLTTLTNGTGISVTGTGNTRTITNTGVVSLTNGLNTTVSQVSPGVWKVDSSGGGGGTITSLSEGAGIDITNPLGPNPTITNSGVLSIQDGPNIVPDVNSGNVTLNLQGVVLGVTAGSGITVGGTATNPTIANSGVISLQNGTGTTVQNVGNGVWQVNATGTAGVTKIIAGSNVSISPVSGTGEVTISAAGGGGGGSITTIQAGTGIQVNSPTGPVTTITNNGVLSVTAGTNVTIGGTANNPTINAVGSLNNLKSGKGISITNATGPEATIVNTGVVGLVAGANVTIQETATGSGVFNISASGGGSGAVASVTGNGAGISVSPTTGAVVVQNTGVTSLAGTANNITVSGSTGAVTLNIGSSVLTNVTAGNSGITVSGTGNSRAVSAAVVNITAGSGINVTPTSGVFNISNTGVLGLTAGSNVTITPTAGQPGNFTISSSGGGGGGTGTVTQINTGPSLTGGPITTTGTIDVNKSESNNNGVITWGAYNRATRGSILYSDTLNHDWSGGLSGSSADDNPMTLIGYFGGGNLATYVEWAFPRVGDLLSSASIDAGGPTKYGSVTNGWKPAVNEGWLKNYVATNVFGNSVGAISFLQTTGTSATWGVIARPASSGTPQVLTLTNNNYAWSALPGAYTAAQPITITGSEIGFNVNTTALTAYVPKSAFTLAGQLLYGTGAGTYGALNIGSNGQVLSVNSSGQLAWVDPPTPSDPISLSPSEDQTIVMSPNPITGTGTIGVNTAKFVLSSVLTTPGDMIVAAGSPALPSRLASSNNVGDVLTVTAASGNTRVGWSSEINGGTY